MVRHFFRRYSPAASLILFGLCLVFFDFLTKAYVYHLLPFKDFPVFSGFFGVDFTISLAFNRGAAWGVFANFQVLLLVLRILMIVGMFLYLFFGRQNRAAQLPLLLIISGAIGNVIDFFLYGYVIDFLQFNLWGYDFPIFNLADTWITIGVGWLFLVSLFQKCKKYA